MTLIELINVHPVLTGISIFLICVTICDIVKYICQREK
jgi:hypothetical protein